VAGGFGAALPHGATRNFMLLVSLPPAFVTWTLPVVAPREWWS
jgi:hypothetical protein